jgi:hypothetical protein
MVDPYPFHPASMTVKYVHADWTPPNFLLDVMLDAETYETC